MLVPPFLPHPHTVGNDMVLGSGQVGHLLEAGDQYLEINLEVLMLQHGLGLSLLDPAGLIGLGLGLCLVGIVDSGDDGGMVWVTLA